MFASLQQKDISGFLTYLWQSDPFKAKWSILAKAYSTIRDNKGKENAPLDIFLAINCGFIGIIAPAAYLKLLGWEIGVDDDGQTILRREFEVDPTSLDRRLVTTNISVDDVVRNSQQNGFFVGEGFSIPAHNYEAAMTMATSAQQAAGSMVAVTDAPNDRIATENNGVCDNFNGSSAHNPTDMSNLAVPSVPQLLQPDNFAYAVVAGNSGSSSNEEVHGPIRADSVQLAAHLPICDPLANAAMDLSSVSLQGSAFHLDSQWPHNMEFDPDSPSFIFDPFKGNHFDVFNMSDWVNEDSFEGLCKYTHSYYNISI